MHYIEQFGLYYAQFGLPRTAGRILGWLLVCDPPHQTMPELANALQTSKSSISGATRLLIQTGLVDRVSLPGERKDFYRLNEEAWLRSWQGRLQAVTITREMAERGLALLAAEPPARRERLQEMHAMFVYLEEELPSMLQRWREIRQRSQD